MLIGFREKTENNVFYTFNTVAPVADGSFMKYVLPNIRNPFSNPAVFIYFEYQYAGGIDLAMYELRFKNGAQFYYKLPVWALTGMSISYATSPTDFFNRVLISTAFSEKNYIPVPDQFDLEISVFESIGNITFGVSLTGN